VAVLFFHYVPELHASMLLTKNKSMDERCCCIGEGTWLKVIKPDHHLGLILKELYT